MFKDLYAYKLKIYGDKENIIKFLDDFYNEFYACFLFEQFTHIDYINNKYNDLDYLYKLMEIENCTKYSIAINNINNNSTEIYYNSFTSEPDINMFKELSKYYTKLKFELFYIDMESFKAKQILFHIDNIFLNTDIIGKNKNSMIRYYNFALQNDLFNIDEVLSEIRKNNDKFNILNYFEEKYYNDEYDIKLN